MNSPTLTARATQLGMILGTAAYMAPEQARGTTVDKRADLWAFGVVLWEMLTGKCLFEGATVSDTLASVLKTEPEWNTLAPTTPSAIRRLLRRCLEKDRKRRLSDAADARLCPSDGRRVVVTRRVQDQLDIWLIDGASMSRVASDPADRRTPIWSPDCTWIVFRSLRRDVGDLYQMLTNGAEENRHRRDANAVRDHQPRQLVPSIRTIRVSMRFAYSRASLLKVEVVMNTPFRARCPCNAPANCWMSGRPTVFAQRLAWM